MTKAHVEHRFEQATEAHRRLVASMILPGASMAEIARVTGSADFQAWQRIKCSQMTRITRRCVRMLRAAS